MTSRSARALARLTFTLVALAPLAIAQDAMPPADATGGRGFARHELAHDDMPPFLRANLEYQLEQSARRLQAEGLLPPPDPSARVNGLQWPLRARAGYTDPDYHGVSNFVDLNPAFPNQLLDYQCGTRSYDLSSGYNHPGIDYFLWPFAWRMMDAQVIEIVAAAPGTIIQAGYSYSYGNRIVIDHGLVNGIGLASTYNHLTRIVASGSVSRGELIAYSGTTGDSTGCHLHFEVMENGSFVNPRKWL